MVMRVKKRLTYMQVKNQSPKTTKVAYYPCTDEFHYEDLCNLEPTTNRPLKALVGNLLKPVVLGRLAI